MTITYTSAGSAFFDAAFNFIGDRELKHNTWDFYPQDVGDGKVTIGAGLNLTSGKEICRWATYNALGIKIDLKTGKALLDNTGTQAQIDAENSYINRLNAALRLSPSQAIIQLHTIMAERAADTRLNGYADNRKSYFAFDPGTSQILKNWGHEKLGSGLAIQHAFTAG